MARHFEHASKARVGVFPWIAHAVLAVGRMLQIYEDVGHRSARLLLLPPAAHLLKVVLAS
ncbi:hypothetical protein BC628DRAFT_1420207 [Trametes gibbosa]|nr:hypothetical protein BC628DRAFT_1420207 [Trametes gibbosa]